MRTLLLALLLSTSLAAQTTPIPVFPGSKQQLAWDMEGGITVVQAQALRYTLYIDAAPTGQVIMQHVCGNNLQRPGVVQCASSIPALGPGIHRLELTAADATTPQSETQKSVPLQVAMIVVPIPTNLRIVNTPTDSGASTIK